MLTREEAHAIYRAGEETVVRVLLDMDRRIHALETFVDRSRFQGTCYQAANWLRLGATRGRTRNDRAHRLRAAVKDVYLYPLVADFRRELCA